MSNIHQDQIPRFKDLLFFSVLPHCKLNIFWVLDHWSVKTKFEDVTLGSGSLYWYFSNWLMGKTVNRIIGNENDHQGSPRLKWGIPSFICPELLRCKWALLAQTEENRPRLSPPREVAEFGAFGVFVFVLKRDQTCWLLSSPLWHHRLSDFLLGVRGSQGNFPSLPGCLFVMADGGQRWFGSSRRPPFGLSRSLRGARNPPFALEKTNKHSLLVQQRVHF